MPRSFVFLQGVISPLFPRLADRLARRGHRVQRVNFCAGDALVWGRRPALNYRGRLGGLETFFARLFDHDGVSDLVLFGDERPVHRPAIALARQRGISVHIFEEGYLRPDWFTLERHGVNANSRLPHDPAWYLAVAPRLPRNADVAPTHPRLSVRARHDMAYHLANLLNPLTYPGYRSHRPDTALREYLGWILRFAPLPWRRRHDARAIARLIGQPHRYFLLPLQLNADVQIARHSPYLDMREVLSAVLTSFARHAAGDARLVIKNHPLDTGLVHYRRYLKPIAADLGIAERLLYLETGHLPTLLDHAAGVVTVNSTVGISALLHQVPTLALGEAIYDMPGLTFQGGLDAFWTEATTPDRALFDAFRKTVVHCTQINGDLYTDEGIAMALARCVQRLEGDDLLAQLLREADTSLPPRGVEATP
jgi:capsular polysaccharide export protein